MPLEAQMVSRFGRFGILDGSAYEAILSPLRVVARSMISIGSIDMVVAEKNTFTLGVSSEPGCWSMTMPTFPECISTQDPVGKIPTLLMKASRTLSSKWPWLLAMRLIEWPGSQPGL